MMLVRQLLISLLLAGLYIGTASAIPVTVNASDYASGTDITNAVDHLTLQAYDHAYHGDSITYSSAIVNYNVLGGGMDPLYDSVIGVYDTVLLGMQDLSDVFAFTGLSITSDQAINSIDWTGFSYGGIAFTLKLFDKNDNYISSIGEYFNSTGSCGGNPCVIGNYNLDLTGYSESVYRIAWSGLFSYANLESFTVDVPEPSSLALLGLGLLGLLLRPNTKKTLKLTKTRLE